MIQKATPSHHIDNQPIIAMTRHIEESSKEEFIE